MRVSPGIHVVFLIAASMLGGRALAQSSRKDVLAIQPLIDDQDDAQTVVQKYQPILEKVLDDAQVAHVPFDKVKAVLASEPDHNCHRKLPCLVRLSNEVGASRVLSISVNLYGRRISIYWWDYTSYGKLLNGHDDVLTFAKHGHSRASQLRWALTHFIRRIRGKLPTAEAVTPTEASSLLANLGGPSNGTETSSGGTKSSPDESASSGTKATNTQGGSLVAPLQTDNPEVTKTTSTGTSSGSSTTKVAKTSPSIPISPGKTEPSEESKGSSSWMCPVCYIVAGVGVAGIAGGLIFHSKTSSDISSIESGLNGVTVPPQGATRQTLMNEIDSSRSHAHLANAFLVGGTVVLAAGVGLFVGNLLSGGHHHSSAVSVSVGATPRFVSATLSF